MNSNHVARHLPSYEESNIQYSLRLPAYRSSYIRRFHPYGRYVAYGMEENDMENCNDDDRDEEMLLDLRILEGLAPFAAAGGEHVEELQVEAPADEFHIEGPLFADVNADGHYGRGPGQFGIFYRIDLNIHRRN